MHRLSATLDCLGRDGGGGGGGGDRGTIDLIHRLTGKQKLVGRIRDTF